MTSISGLEIPVRQYLLSSATDVYLFTVLGWCKFFAIDLDRWPAISAFQDRIGSRESVRDALQAEAAGDKP